jgi:DNA primase large subunit
MVTVGWVYLEVARLINLAKQFISGKINKGKDVLNNKNRTSAQRQDSTIRETSEKD